MAAPAPVQLQRRVTVSDLVCCVFVYDTNIHANVGVGSKCGHTLRIVHTLGPAYSEFGYNEQIFLL